MDQKILEALKTINAKLGGTNDPDEKWGTLLQEIAENIGEGGGGSGAGSFLVTLSYNEQDQALTMDKTYGEIEAAIKSGQYITVVDTTITEEEENLMAIAQTIPIVEQSDADYFVVYVTYPSIAQSGNIEFIQNMFMRYTTNSKDGYPMSYINPGE